MVRLIFKKWITYAPLYIKLSKVDLSLSGTHCPIIVWTVGYVAPSKIPRKFLGNSNKKKKKIRKIRKK